MWLVASCSFHVDAAENPDATAAPSDARDAPTCAPVLIDERFDNLDLATAGPLSTGAGFTAVTNASSGNGSSVEIAGGGLEIRTSNNATPQAPVHGVASITSFAFNPAGMTVRLQVASADIPIWNGIALGIQSNQTTIDAAGGSLVLRIRGQGTNQFRVDMGNQNTYDPPLDLEPYDSTGLADGFVVTWMVDASSWSYRVEGLLASGGPITAGGGYRAGQTPADVLDATAHLGIHIQGNPNDTSPRVLRVDRLTLWDGVCQ